MYDLFLHGFNLRVWASLVEEKPSYQKYCYWFHHLTFKDDCVLLHWSLHWWFSLIIKKESYLRSFTTSIWASIITGPQYFSFVFLSFLIYSSGHRSLKKSYLHFHPLQIRDNLHHRPFFAHPTFIHRSFFAIPMKMELALSFRCKAFYSAIEAGYLTDPREETWWRTQKKRLLHHHIVAPLHFHYLNFENETFLRQPLNRGWFLLHLPLDL